MSWDRLKALTPARIGLPRAGHSLATRPWLELQHAHARARDAVFASWNHAALAEALPSLVVTSRAGSREEFLKRPDRGRDLDDKSSKALRAAGTHELVLCVSDGLSALAVERHFLPLWQHLAPALDGLRLDRAPLVLVRFGRVAVADRVAMALGAKLAVIFIGERPGLSAADSLGIYLTYAPEPNLPDSRRNCISNVRPPEGLSYELAARRLISLIQESLRQQLSGIALKDTTPVNSLPE